MSEVNLILDAIRQGEATVDQTLLPAMYEELRQLARARMAREKPGHTLQATSLVHEAWLRLGESRFQNQAHFFAAAAEAMRRILIEHARRKQAARHGAGAGHIALDDCEIVAPHAIDDQLIAVNDALDALAEHDPRKAQLVKLRYFVGLKIEEAAAVLNISAPTAKRDWTYARAWLYREMQRR